MKYTSILSISFAVILTSNVSAEIEHDIPETFVIEFSGNYVMPWNIETENPKYRLYSGSSSATVLVCSVRGDLSSQPVDRNKVILAYKSNDTDASYEISKGKCTAVHSTEVYVKMPKNSAENLDVSGYFVVQR